MTLRSRLRYLVLLLIGSTLWGCATSPPSSSSFGERLAAGANERIVLYGTSLTAKPWSTWEDDLQAALDEAYPGQATIINAAAGGMWSTWGVENLDERVLAHNPDSVLIEFGINDAYIKYETSVDLARANLANLIERIQSAHPNCEIILMTMNPPAEQHLEMRPNFEAYYDMYRETAAMYNLLLIDHHKNWNRILKRDPKLFNRYVSDGVHPGPEGCSNVIAPAIIRALLPNFQP